MRDVKGTVRIFDAITNQTLEQAIIPLECEIPETDLVEATTTIASTTLLQTTLLSRQNQQKVTTKTTIAATTLLSRQNRSDEMKLLQKNNIT